MEKLLIFDSAKEVRFGKLLKFIIPTYLTALFNTVYTIVDGIFVSSYVGTNALAAINIVYPIVNILTGIALAFATGGSALAALHIGGERKEEANRTFSISMLLSLLYSCCYWKRAAYLFYSRGRLTHLQLFDGAFRRSPKYCIGLCFCELYGHGDFGSCTCYDFRTVTFFFYGTLLFCEEETYLGIYISRAVFQDRI